MNDSIIFHREFPPHSVRQGSGTTVQLRWQDHISILHLFAWLMLGAMCHNAIDMVAVEMKIDGSVSGQCKLLGSLSTHHEQVTKGIIKLLLGALTDVSLANEGVSICAAHPYYIRSISGCTIILDAVHSALWKRVWFIIMRD